MAGNDNLFVLLSVAYYVPFTVKCSYGFICDLNYHVLCILLHSCPILCVFGMKQDSTKNTALLGRFSHPIFLVFPNSRIRHNNGDKSSTRSCLYEEEDYTAELYFLKY